MVASKPVIREFPYRANRLQTALLFVLALGGMVVLGYLALYADRGANLKVIQFTRDQYRVLLGVLAVLSPFGLIMLGWLLVSSFIHERRVAFTADSVIVPKPSVSGMSTEEIELPFDEILAVQVAPYIGRTRIVQIVSDTGVISIPSNMLPHRGDFDAIAEMLSAILEERDRG